MNYLYLIKQLFSYEKYQTYRNSIQVTKEEDKEIYWLFKALDDIYQNITEDITFEDYYLWVLTNLGNDYKIFLDVIKNQDSNEILLQKTLQTLKNKKLYYNLSEVALKIAEGKVNKNEIEKILSKLEEDLDDGKSPFVEDSLMDIYNDQIRDKGLVWRLPSLNKSLGSLRKGDFGVIFARPETGKTTFLASECSFFAEQINDPILWFNNEEKGSKVKLRCIQASLGLQTRDLENISKEDLEHYNKEFLKKSKDNIKIFDSEAIHRNTVEKLCKKYKPALVVFDQLSKIKGFNNDREDLRLGAAFAWARELAKQYCPVIGINQADVSGEGKKYLTMDNVAGAKTAIQAEADFILGIGASHDNGFEFIRHLNISKNKLLGDNTSDSSLRHGKFDVLIEPDIARYRDL